MGLVDAIRRGDVEGFTDALESGEDVNSLDADARTPLMHAASAGNLELTEVLLEAGADPSLRDLLDESALLKAAAEGHPAVYARLLRYAKPEEKAFAATLLRTSPHGPLPPGPPSTDVDSVWSDRFARAGAYVADKLGDSDPKARLARVLRSRKLRK